MRIFHNDPGVVSCSFNGETIERAEDGSFEVSDAAAVELAAHGFTTVPPEVKPVEIPSGNPAKWTKDVLLAEASRLGVDSTLARGELLKAIAEARKAEADAAAVELGEGKE